MMGRAAWLDTGDESRIQPSQNAEDQPARGNSQEKAVAGILESRWRRVKPVLLVLRAHRGLAQRQVGQFAQR